MLECEVALLDVHCDLGRDDHVVVAQGKHLAAAVAAVPDRRDAHLPRLLQTLQDIFRVARCADGHKHIALLSQRLDLPLEDVVVAVVIADRRDDGRIRRQRDRSQRRPVHREPRDELRRQVLRVCSRAAVARDHQLAPVQHRLRRLLPGLDDGLDQVVVGEDLLKGRDAVIQLLADEILHGGSYETFGSAGGCSKLMRSSSTAYGRFCTWV